MQEVTFIFVNTQSTIAHRLTGLLINAFEHSTNDFASHIAIQFDYLKGYGPCILEATGKGVLLTDYNKYDAELKQCRITIELSDTQYELMEKKAIEIAERKYEYSYKACVIGGIANSISRKLGKFISKLLNADKDQELNCSETGITLLREVYYNFCNTWANAEITPYDIYINLLIESVFGGISITKVNRYENK